MQEYRLLRAKADRDFKLQQLIDFVDEVEAAPKPGTELARPIFFSGTLALPEKVTDPEFGVSVSHPALSRKVEVYMYR